MMDKMQNKRVALITSLLAAAILPILTGCVSSQTDTDWSRAKLYSSVSDLSTDSALVVAVIVTDQHTADDIDNGGDFTLSTVELQSIAKDSTGRNLKAGTSIVVRQIGSDDQPGPATLLTTGKAYLLYLTPSGLTGDLADQFYVSGGAAGLYQATSSTTQSLRSNTADPQDTKFTSLDDEGDDLPASISIADALR